ncbi:MAG TPA: hypothetical protein VEF06_03850 [Bryobacteraceae bacterium]|nr:hypothetical protein [Bryobacteraceae bacterium]
MTGAESWIDILVFTALAAALAFTIVWALSPGLRRWIERPKFTFQARLNGESK